MFLKLLIHLLFGWWRVQAPEVLKRGEYSFASDVYSYGMILVELTTLQPPYKQEQFKQLRKITAHAEVPHPTPPFVTHARTHARWHSRPLAWCSWAKRSSRTVCCRRSTRPSKSAPSSASACRSTPRPGTAPPPPLLPFRSFFRLRLRFRSLSLSSRT